MAQLDDQAAVVADDSVDSAAAENDSANAPATDDQQDDVGLEEMYPDERAPAGDEANEGEDGADAEEEGEEDGDEGEDSSDKPEPVAAPQSWKAEEKALFAKLPPEAQQVITRREAERDQFVRLKGEEVVRTREALHQEAFQALAQIRAQQAQELDQFAAMIVPQKPSYRLQAEDPDAFAEQMEAFEFWTAQQQQVQQTAQQRRQEAETIQQQVDQRLAAQEAQRSHAILSEKFPEYLDEDSGPKLREELGSIAIELGYPAELLAQVDATDILAMRTARDWKAKAAKWDDLQSRRMADVRAGKSNKQPPRIARPGAARNGTQPRSSDPLKLLYPND